jgi:hypothetical protein
MARIDGVTDLGAGARVRTVYWFARRALRQGFQAYLFRPITDEHRLVYRTSDDQIRIASCDITTKAEPRPPDSRVTIGAQESPAAGRWCCASAVGLPGQHQKTVNRP